MIRLILCFSITWFLISNPAYSLTGWTDVKQITNTTGTIDSFSCQINPDNGNIYFVFADDSGVPNKNGIFIKRSMTNGKTLENPYFVSPLNVNSINPAVYSKNNYVYLCWQDNRDNICQIFFKKSLDNGVTWESDIQISDGTTDSSKMDLILDSSDALHIIWINNGEVKYKKGFNNGINWSDVKTINSGSCDAPKILIVNNEPYIFWQAGSPSIIKYCKSSDGGLNWSDPCSISSSNASLVSVASDSKNNIYAVWQQDNKIYFRKYENGSWFSGISINTSGIAKFPSITVDSNDNIHICWIDDRDVLNKIYYTNSSDKGSTFIHEIPLNTVSVTGSIALISYSLNLHLFWKDGSQVYYRMEDVTSPSLILSSETHKVDIKSSNNSPEFTWQAEDNAGGIGIAGFSYVFDKNDGTVPPAIVNYSGSSISFPYTENGTYFFHIRSVDELNNWSETFQYEVIVDNDTLLPREEIWCQPNPVKSSKPNIRYFLAKDSYITITLYNEAGEKITSMDKEGNVGVNNETTIDMSNYANGLYFYKINAKDKLTGSSEEFVKKLILLR
ncbi:MAG: T9SS type A sorting domain-containing protein [Candidatus Firestonebacteria bacterium]